MKLAAGSRCRAYLSSMDSLLDGWVVQAPAFVAGVETDLYRVAIDGEWSPRGGMTRLFTEEDVHGST